MAGSLSPMTDTLRVILEIGAKRRVVAGALDWPGLDRWGPSEDGAVDKLSAYLPRYAGVAERAGGGRVPAGGRPSRSSNACPARARPTGASRTCGRRSRARSLLRRTWSGDSASCVPAGPTSTTSWRGCPELRPTGRGGGRTRDQIIRSRTPRSPRTSRAGGGRTGLQGASPGTGSRRTGRRPRRLRTENAERAGRRRPGRSGILVRRTAQHVMRAGGSPGSRRGSLGPVLREGDGGRADRGRAPDVGAGPQGWARDVGPMDHSPGAGAVR